MKNLTSLYNHFQERKWNQFLLKCNKTITFIFLFFVLLSANSFAQVAPVTVPSGGFSIDGGLKANTPTTGIGDWLFGVGGPGDSVLHSDGTPFNSKTSGRAKDPYNSNDDIFTNGSKFNDYIGNLRWFTNSSPDKNDINNALYHIARDTSNNQWAFIAGDRLSTSGTSYIDFEFLQGTVTKNSNGTFTGTPANDGKQSGGGRTDGDMLISMEYTNGGSKPNVYIYQWKLSGSIWAFQQVTNLTDLNLNAFAETNRTGPEDVSYGAFGSNTYAQYAFVEAAINVSYLLRQTSLNFCTGLSIKTLWVKTKASASSTAALKDFVTPIPVDFQFGTTNITAIGPFCLDNSTPQTLSATPSGGTFSGGFGLTP